VNGSSKHDEKAVQKRKRQATTENLQALLKHMLANTANHPKYTPETGRVFPQGQNVAVPEPPEEDLACPLAIQASEEVSNR
jgi:hypothetical protein